MKIVPTIALSVPYSSWQTAEEAERNREAVRWAQHALAQLGFNTIAPGPDSVHFQVTDESADILPPDERREWCRETMKQQIMHGLVHGTIVFFPKAERCTDSQIEVSAAKKARDMKNSWLFYIGYDGKTLMLPDNLMDLHQTFLDRQDYC